MDSKNKKDDSLSTRRSILTFRRMDISMWVLRRYNTGKGRRKFGEHNTGAHGVKSGSPAEMEMELS